MNLVDSSGWLEYFADGTNADFFAPAIENTIDLVVPTLSLCEVFKKILQQSSESEALKAIAFMQQAHVVVLDATTALSAAKISVEMKLPMADSIILATSRAYDARLWTQDADFFGIEGVEFVEKQR
jgi:predicted nucleic acid-binding protein